MSYRQRFMAALSVFKGVRDALHRLKLRTLRTELFARTFSVEAEIIDRVEGYKTRNERPAPVPTRGLELRNCELDDSVQIFERVHVAPVPAACAGELRRHILRHAAADQFVTPYATPAENAVVDGPEFRRNFLI